MKHNKYSKRIVTRQFQILLYAITFILALSACGSDDNGYNGGNGGSGGSNANVNRNIATNNSNVTRMEFPHLRGGNSIIITHSTNDTYGINYSLEWDCEKMSQRWSCYQMYKGYTGNAGRYDPHSNPGSHYGDLQYPYDPNLPSEYYLDDDYFYGSGFDHGHICPSADRQYSKEANYQTFFLTNMQPQYNRFNAYLWADMEGKVRTWTLQMKNSDTIYACKGGTIDNEANIIKRIKDKLIVPKYFYMAVLLKNSLGYRAIALWAENENRDRSGDNIGNYAITIDELEKRTGIDFFCNLPDNIENTVESSIALNAWGLK